LLPFFLGQFISVGSSMAKIEIARPPIMFNNKILPILLLLLLVVFSWIGSDSFQDFDKNRVAQAEGAGLKNLILGSITTLVVISIRYESFLYTLLIAALLFIATATKQMLFFPFLLFIAEKFKLKYSKFDLLKIIILIPFILISAQLIRSDGNFDIDSFFYGFAVPFDAYDNAVTIISQIYTTDLLKITYPNDLQYFIESFLNFIPRSIWSMKPEVQGFWRIQRDYLPDLFTDTLGMSVSTSLPVDILLSFGIFIGSAVLFLFARFLKLIDTGSIKIGFLYPLLLSFSVEFSRGGFRNVVMILLSAFIIYVFILLLRVACKLHNSIGFLPNLVTDLKNETPN
jgi:hypothetical protein